MGVLKGGSPDSFADSLAKAIEDAMNDLLEADGMERLPTDDSDATRDRRRLFCAIARGVTRHLAARESAFEINIRDPGDPGGPVMRHPNLSSD